MATLRGTVLVVEDNHEILKLTTFILTKAGYQVRPAENGELALTSISNYLPDLILLDIYLPGMDGFEVIRRIKAREECRNIPVIFLSAASEVEKRTTAFTLGAVDFISKPFHAAELLARVHTHLELYQLRIRLEQQTSTLLASEAKYRDLYENAPVAYFSVTNDGLIKESNAAAQLLYGYTCEEMKGKSRLDLYPAEDLSQAAEIFEQLKNGISIKGLEVKQQRKDGSQIYGLLSATPILDEKGQVVNIRSVVRDISERKQAEAAALEIESLKRITQAKSELLNNVSHELKTPLAAIKGFIETLIETDVKWNKKEQLEFLQSANMEADKLNLLIKDLLDMSRFDSGNVVLDKHSYKIADIFGSINRELSLITLNYKLKILQDSELPVIEVDKTRIGQVITNLVSNSVKFSTEGSQIVIEVKKTDQSVLFSVEDKGIGMPPKVLSSLFNKFYQSYQVVAGKTKGTGLGLAISKSIVEAHGGKIWAESQVGQGSKFSFSIPV